MKIGRNNKKSAPNQYIRIELKVNLNDNNNMSQFYCFYSIFD